MMLDGKLVATVSGFVERVNKLISVRPLNARYHGEVGDVVIGRVTEVADRRWRIDLNSKQNCVLMLSSVNLPGGVQRRRTFEDALQMRTFFTENDLISAEVQKIMHDGSINLHTRNQRYGKLVNGQFVSVSSGVIRRTKQHFHSLECGVDVILGTNGYIWISEPNPLSDEMTDEKDETFEPPVVKPVAAPVREKIARVRNSILALSKMFMPIFSNTIMDVYNESITLGLLAKDVLHPDNLQAVTQLALENLNRKDRG